MKRIAKALDYLESQKHIHGDVKPTNILFVKDDKGRLTAYLSDMEIAKPTSTGDAGKNKDEYPGTMAYLAREVFLDKESASHHSDQFALAATLYQWLSGELPFEGLNGIEMYKAFKKGCQPISELCPELPQPACEALHRALADEPEQRFETSGEFAAAFTGSLPVRARPTTRLNIKTASNIFFAVAASVLLLALAGRFLRATGTGEVSEKVGQAGEEVRKPELPSAISSEEAILQADQDLLAKNPVAEPAMNKDLTAKGSASRYPEQYFQSAFLAAEQPNATASNQFKLAQMYEMGYGCKVDLNKAYKYYEKAALQDRPKVSRSLAKFCEEHGRQDLASQWIQKAREQENKQREAQLKNRQPSEAFQLKQKYRQ